MGNNSGKKQCQDPCGKNLDEIFYTLSNKKNAILRNDLRNTWSSRINEELYTTFESYLFKTNQYELSSQTFKQFYLDLCKGDVEQKVFVVFELLGGKNEVPGMKMYKFISNILSSVLMIQKSKSPKRYNSWSSRMLSVTSPHLLETYTQYFLSQTYKSVNDEFTEQELRTLLIHLDFFLIMIISRLYDTEDKHFYVTLLPKWKYNSVDSGKNLNDISVLDMTRIIFLNFELPFDFQHEWRILFSTSVHGESFSKLAGEISNKGATIIIVKDKDGYIFGGFAPQSWYLGPTFQGDARSFLFTLYPSLNFYPATNFNDNYQYMNVGQQTMPNGLGMGGRLEYFALWLDAEFGKGYCSESCTTYRNYKMMSGSKEFEVSHVEVWGIGSPPISAAELGERSVLDNNLEAKAMLEMAGKTAYSDGLREDIDN